MPLSRRELFQTAGLAGLAAASAPRLVLGANAARPRDTLVMVFLRGGMDSLNVLVPYGDGDYYRHRPNIAIPPPGGGEHSALALDGFFALNPKLQVLEQSFRAGSLAWVAATGMKTGSRSHFECQDRIERGYADASAGPLNGWLDRHLEAIGNSGTFQAAAVGGGVPVSLRGAAPSIGFKTIEAFQLGGGAGAEATIAVLSGLYEDDSVLSQTAQLALNSVSQLAAANPAQYATADGAVYPATRFGGQLREVAQLIKSNIGLEVACLDLHGWDHHDREAARMDPLLEDLAGALSAFETDLGALMAGVTIVAMTEFGRRVAENASQGTDHGTASAMLLMGGGVAGGQVYTLWPGLKDSELDQGDLDVTIDYRSVLSELLVKRLGNKRLDLVFPGFRPQPFVGAFRSL
jgi:uncharacterized protein (DUF1501 family)